MVNFKKFYNDAGLTIFDIDETAFRTTAKISVINTKTGKVKKLSNQEYNVYKLQPNEKFDFSEFSDAELFRKTSKPIYNVLNRINKIIEQIKQGGRSSKVLVLTARSDIDDMEEFKNKFRDHGVNIDEVEIIAAGTYPGGAAEKKKKIIRAYLETGDFARVRMFEDSKENLEAFLSLEKEFPDIEFTAYRVDHDDRVYVIKGVGYPD